MPKPFISQIDLRVHAKAESFDKVDDAHSERICEITEDIGNTAEDLLRQAIEEAGLADHFTVTEHI